MSYMLNLNMYRALLSFKLEVCKSFKPLKELREVCKSFMAPREVRCK